MAWRCAACRPARATAPIVLDPLGQLVVKQQVVPLNTWPRHRDLRQRTGGRSAALHAHRVAQRHAAAERAGPGARSRPAQFFVMSDDEKLAAPSFQSMDAGSVFGEARSGLRCHTGYSRRRSNTKSIPITLDGPAPAAELTPTPPPPPSFAMEADQLQVFARSGAAARAPVRRVGRARFRNERVEGAATLGAETMDDPADRRWPCRQRSSPRAAHSASTRPS